MHPQVRANSLQELVYKQGQAGVTKATVSIVFNNSDKANGPVEYQHLDQITVTRQVRLPLPTCEVQRANNLMSNCSSAGLFACTCIAVYEKVLGSVT